MITLYHGSYVSVQDPLVKLGRKKVDFGQGFYLTKLRPQAESWAIAIAERKGRNTLPTVSSFLFDFDAVVDLIHDTLDLLLPFVHRSSLLSALL